MAKCSKLGYHGYDETEEDVVRAGNAPVITVFLSEKVIEEE